MDVEQAVAGVPAVRWTPRRLLPASDERLAQLVATGDEQAFATLYDRYHQRLYRYCRSMLGNDADAQDALQSTFAGAFTALAESRRDAPVRPWLYRIAHNESISIVRRRKPEVEIAEEHVGAVASTADVAEDRDRLAVLMADLGELTERQRAALVLRELSGLSHAEIAATLGIDVSGAKQTIFEARRSLQEFAEGRAMICDEVCRAISSGGGRTLRGRRVKAHLRDCQACRDFAQAIPARARDLRAIAPPLAIPAAIGILRRALASSSGHAGGGAGVVAGTAGKAAAMLTAAKLLAGTAAVMTVAAGATLVVPSVGPLAASRQADVMLLGTRSPAPAEARPPGAATHGDGNMAVRPALHSAAAAPRGPRVRATVHNGQRGTAAAFSGRFRSRSARSHGAVRAPAHAPLAAAGIRAHRSAGRRTNHRYGAARSRVASTSARRPASARRSGRTARHRAHRTSARPLNRHPAGRTRRSVSLPKVRAGLRAPRFSPTPLSGAAKAHLATVLSSRAGS
ncbi:MAG TPA: RNA polymerase sigma factor [Solirubrobacteraceae bacterium]